MALKRFLAVTEPSRKRGESATSAEERAMTRQGLPDRRSMDRCRKCGSTDRVTVHRLVDARYPISEFIPEGSENQLVDPACFVFDHVVDIPVCDDCIGRRTERRRLLAAALALGYSYFVIGAWVSRGADSHAPRCRDR